MQDIYFSFFVPDDSFDTHMRIVKKINGEYFVPQIEWVKHNPEKTCSKNNDMIFSPAEMRIVSEYLKGYFKVIDKKEELAILKNEVERLKKAIKALTE